MLDILIPTLPARGKFLQELMTEIDNQRRKYPNGTIQVLTDPRPSEFTTGEKRNWLLRQATSKYVWQIDDDDLIYPGAIDLVVNAMTTEPDCMGINGIMTTNGASPAKWIISLGSKYELGADGVYYRHPNHITPMKRELALQVSFKHIHFGEDYHWAVELKERNILKTQIVIEPPIYLYRLRVK